MQTVLPTTHDIESHIPTLRKLDAVRRRSAQLRDLGMVALDKLLTEEKSAKKDLIHKLTAIRVLEAHAPGTTQKRAEDLVKNISIAQLLADDFQTLTAAQLVALACESGSLTLTRPTFLAIYILIVEIYRIYPGDWTLGSARVSPIGWPSAYTTAQCVKSILSVERVLRRTAELLSAVHAMSLEEHAIAASKVPPEWKEVHCEHTRLAASITLAKLSKGAAIQIDWPKDPSQLGTFLEKIFPEKIEADLKNILTQSESATIDITVHRENDILPAAMRRRGGDRDLDQLPDEKALAQERARKELLTSIGHDRGLATIRSVVDYTNEAIRLSQLKDWQSMSDLFNRAAEAIHRIAAPCRGYLSNVIDHQLTRHGDGLGRICEPVELAFAATGYCEFGIPNNDADAARIAKATNIVFSCIEPDGGGRNKRPFHRLERGSDLVASNTFLLKAASELIRFAGFDMPEEIASRFLPFFEDRLVKNPSNGQVDGWRSEHDRSVEGARLWSTACAVDTLSMINAVLDEHINQIVLEHFSVKRSVAGPKLENLFFSDYGLASAKSVSDSRVNKYSRSSVALTLQRMRAHVLRTGPVDRLHSIVLHGPAGTGKTTLLEALAVSCECPLVEVTPSDLSKLGADAIEQRARAVFEALSLLTRAVIILDEFDPVLKRRNHSNTGESNAFSFLTPGMLPKLKALSESAKYRSVAYALVTNLIGTLDEAATRQGRFDEKVGVYPPDPLSRLGYLRLAAEKFIVGRKLKINESRLFEVSAKTAGLGMTALMMDGWFRGSNEKLVASRPLGYVLEQCNQLTTPFPDPEDRHPSKPMGSGLAAEREWAQWGWIVSWDSKFEELAKHATASTIKRKTTEVREWVGKSSDKSIESLENILTDIRRRA